VEHTSSTSSYILAVCIIGHFSYHYHVNNTCDFGNSMLHVTVLVECARHGIRSRIDMDMCETYIIIA